MSQFSSGSKDDLRLVEIGVRCSLEQMLEEGFYHAGGWPAVRGAGPSHRGGVACCCCRQRAAPPSAPRPAPDPPPGNLLRTRDGRLADLDFGMMGSVDATIRRSAEAHARGVSLRRWRVRRAAHPHTRLKRHAPRGLIRATLHLVNREFEALADDFVTLGMLPRVGGLVCGRAGDAKPECRALGRRTYPTTHPPLPHSAWVAQDSEKLDVACLRRRSRTACPTCRSGTSRGSWVSCPAMNSGCAVRAHHTCVDNTR